MDWRLSKRMVVAATAATTTRVSQNATVYQGWRALKRASLLGASFESTDISKPPSS